MVKEYDKRYKGHCSGCDRKVVLELPTTQSDDKKNKQWVRCVKCNTPVPCKSANSQ